jgi:hypothetical protein
MIGTAIRRRNQCVDIGEASLGEETDGQEIRPVLVETPGQPPGFTGGSDHAPVPTLFE